MKSLVIALLFVGSALGQPKSPSKPVAPTVLTPAESSATLKLELALEKQKNIQLEAQVLQSKIEPQMAPLRREFAAQEKEIQADSEAIEKASGWGKDVSLDRNPQSATYGKFVRK